MFSENIFVIIMLVYLLLGLFLASVWEVNGSSVKRIFYAWMLIFLWPINAIEYLIRHIHLK